MYVDTCRKNIIPIKYDKIFIRDFGASDISLVFFQNGF